MSNAPNQELALWLRDVRYPATRSGLLEHATARGATDTVLGRIAAIPDREYRDLNDVDRACQPEP
jgi:hypothetical protein